MTGHENEAAVDALVLHPDDGVATALRPLTAGTQAWVMTPNGPRKIRIVEDIRRCHKFALADISAGSEVRKYGEIIGDATTDIEAGCHVHIHNLVGRSGS